MEITKIVKRDSTINSFHLAKVSNAIFKAMEAVGKGSKKEADVVAEKVNHSLQLLKKADVDFVPTVEQVQDIVEQRLMESNYLDVAKAYILYRNRRAEKRKSDIFERRVNLKPYEYPQLYDYVPAIRHSYWIHTEFNFTSDIQDYKSRLTDTERSAIKNTMLAISQIEVAVKSFWGDLYLSLIHI